MLILLLLAQTCLIGFGISDLSALATIQNIFLSAAFLVFGIILINKFIWHIQDFDVELDDQMRGSHFGVYLMATLGFPFICMTPFIWYYMGIDTSMFIKQLGIAFLIAVIAFELLMFNRLVDYFSEDEDV